MQTVKVKTNIMCAACVARITPVLNEAVGPENWKVDIQDPNKLLSVSTEKLDEEQIIRTVQDAGFKAERV